MNMFLFHMHITQEQTILRRETENQGFDKCPVQNGVSSLAEMRHKIHVLEENLVSARDKAKFAERDLRESETRAVNAEKDLHFLKEQANNMEQKFYIYCEENKLEKMKLEERAMAAEHQVSIIEKTRTELAKMTNMTLLAEKEHTDIAEKVKLLETELRKSRKRDQKAKAEFTNAQIKFYSQKEDLVRRANHAEDKLVNVKKTVQAAEAKIQVFGQKIVEVELTLCEVKAQADKEIAGLQRQLTHATKRAESAETELRVFEGKLRDSERELQEARARIEKAENGLLSLNQAKCHTEGMLKIALEQAKRESHEAATTLHRVEKALVHAGSKKQEIEEGTENMCGVQELLKSAASMDTTKEESTCMTNGHIHNGRTWKKDELNKLESLLSGCMESAKGHLTARTNQEKVSRKKGRKTKASINKESSNENMVGIF
jgi:predicted  nucleic acid-binding Zn-ribbon protein